MNRQIARLSFVTLGLFGILVLFTSLNTWVRAKSLDDNPLNRRQLLEQQKIPRGLILADNGMRLATNKKLGSGETKRFYRVYPANTLFSHAIGYSFISHGDAGIEHSFNSQLEGQENEFRSIA